MVILVEKYAYLIGLVAGKGENCLASLPSIFTRIEAHAVWIKKTVEAECKLFDCSCASFTSEATTESISTTPFMNNTTASPAPTTNSQTATNMTTSAQPMTTHSQTTSNSTTDVPSTTVPSSTTCPTTTPKPDDEDMKPEPDKEDDEYVQMKGGFGFLSNF